MNITKNNSIRNKKRRLCKIPPRPRLESNNRIRLCSACLLGIRCRYDGRSKTHKKVVALSRREALIPVCPAQMAHLPIPREPSEIKDGKVITKSGRDLTEKFRKGAEEVLRLAKYFRVKEAVLKQKSPSCGCGKIHDGTFSGNIIKGDGITAALLKKNGIRVISEESLSC